MHIAIKSLYGRWRGNIFKGLSGETVWGDVLILANNTEERIVYSAPDEFAPGRWTDEIGADTGEAICFVHPGDRYSRVAVGPLAGLVNWAGYYFHTPQFSTRVSLKFGSIIVDGVPITLKILRSYPPETKEALFRKLIVRSCMKVDEKKVIESLLRPGLTSL